MAFVQQLKRTSPKPVLPLFIECEVEKAHWGWSYMERWSSARPWESRIFENHSAFKDVTDGQVSKSVDVNTTRNAKDTSRRASLAATPPPQTRTSGELANGPRSRQSRAASPRSRCSDDVSEGSASAAASAARSTTSILTDPQVGTRYSNSGPVRNGAIVDTEVKSPPVVKGHLQATQSVKNKARSASQPRSRPAAGAFKTPATMKRLSYAKAEHGPAAATPPEDGRAANPRFSGQLGRPAHKAVVGRPKSGVLPGPHQYRDM
jgi:hypothetical protein